MLVVLCAGMFLVLLDVTVVNVALPGIGRALGTGLPGLQGVVDGYAVAVAGLLLGGGAIGDRIGHRRLVLIGFTLFAVASLACGLAPGATALVAARVVQGAGAALLLPGSMAMITTWYPGRAEQARALGTWAAVSSTALPAGPVLGGLVVDGVGWRWLFLLNVPLAGLAAVLVAVLVREPAGQRTAAPLDLPGLVLAPVALGAGVWTAICAGHGQVRGAVAAAVTAVLAGVALTAVERRATAPLLPRDLLARPDARRANTVCLIMNLVTNGTLFVVTLLLQQVHGYSARTAGLMLLPLALPLVLLAPVSGRLTARYGPGPVVTAGIGCAVAGALGLLAAGSGGGYPLLLPALVGLGVGDGLLTTAAVSVAMGDAPADRKGVAGGANNTARQAGTALGVALYGAISGPAAPAAAFLTRVHVLAWVGTALWLTALGVWTVVGRRHTEG
ncbi:MFS transporter [Streptomyces sp. Ru73]|nr:MFS transporter [Streptomyces sp. Ru73]